MAKLKKEGNRNHQLSDRSLNYYVTGINNVLNRAVEEGWLPCDTVNNHTVEAEPASGRSSSFILTSVKIL